MSLTHGHADERADAPLAMHAPGALGARQVAVPVQSQARIAMAKSQVSFEKRRREVEKKRKAEEKRDRRRDKKDDDEPTGYNYASSDEDDGGDSSK